MCSRLFEQLVETVLVFIPVIPIQQGVYYIYKYLQKLFTFFFPFFSSCPEYQKETLDSLKEQLLGKNEKRRKRKKKGPNPLSCLKKKLKPNPEESKPTGKRKSRFRIRVPKHVQEMGNNPNAH